MSKKRNGTSGRRRGPRQPRIPAPVGPCMEATGINWERFKQKYGFELSKCVRQSVDFEAQWYMMMINHKSATVGELGDEQERLLKIIEKFQHAYFSEKTEVQGSYETPRWKEEALARALRNGLIEAGIPVAEANKRWIGYFERRELLWNTLEALRDFLRRDLPEDQPPTSPPKVRALDRLVCSLADILKAEGCPVTVNVNPPTPIVALLYEILPDPPHSPEAFERRIRKALRKCQGP